MKYIFINHVDRYKTRLITKNFKQILETNYENTFSLILKYEFLRMFLYFACKYNFHIEQMNAPNAYLQSFLNDEIYMKPSQGLMLFSHLTNHVLRVLKKFYDFKQFGRKGNKKTINYLIFMNFKTLLKNNCVFVNHITHVIINLYVDNFLIFFKSMTVIKKFKNLLVNEYNMKDLKSAKFILKIRIRREKNKIMIDQSFYIRSFLQKYKMNKTNSIFIFMINYDACNSVIVNKLKANQLKYQKRIKNLMFLMINTRSNIAQTIEKFSQYTHNSAIKHRNAVNHLMKYLNEITNLAFIYEFNDIEFINYADAAYDDNHDKKSSYDHVLMLKNEAIIWASKKQRSIVTFIMKTKYFFMCQVSKNIMWAIK